MSNANSGSSSRQDRLNRIIVEYLEAVESEIAPDRQEMLGRHSDLAAELQAFFADHDKMKKLAGPTADTVTLPPSRAEVSDAATLPPSDAQAISADTVPLAGTKVRYFGDYELLEEIARGGMGVVYKARQISLNRIVALKMILTGQLAGEEEVKRFHAEAEAAANLDHPGIVPIFEVGEHEGQHYFSMGYVEGESLSARISDGPLPPREAAELTKEVAEAVAYAHEHGVIHRDLKPANVLLDKDGQSRVTDFGLAKRVEGDSNLTATGQILGTPSYMPPEQAAGDILQITPASDVYSVGAILYELLTGRPPFKATSPLDTLMQVLDNQPVPPRLLNPNIPRDLETICMKCLQKEPSLRYATAPALTDDLNRFMGGELIHASSINLLDRVSRTLAHGHHDEHFQSWGRGMIAFGVIIFLAHAVMYALSMAGYGPLITYWIPRVAMFGAIFLLIWYVRPQSMLPTLSAERPVWAVWIGYLIALGTVNLAMYILDHNPTELFVFSAILSGFGFFVMGSHVWGGSYLIGLVFFAAAPLLALAEQSSVFLFGALWGAALFTLGSHYWLLGSRSRRNRRPTFNSQT